MKLPWLDRPLPCSSIQPSLTGPHRLHTLKVKPTQFRRTFPYERDADQTTMPYFEWRGNSGAPPEDVGYPGDTYLDLTVAGHFMLYASISGKWVRWKPSIDEDDIIGYPFLNDRFLWCQHNRITWYCINTIKRDLRTRNPYPNVNDAIKTALQNDGEGRGAGKRVHDELDSDDSEDGDYASDGSEVARVTRHRAKHGRFEAQKETGGPSSTLSKAARGQQSPEVSD